MFLKNKNIICKTRRSKVTDYAALNYINSIANIFALTIHIYFNKICVDFSSWGESIRAKTTRGRKDQGENTAGQNV